MSSKWIFQVQISKFQIRLHFNHSQFKKYSHCYNCSYAVNTRGNVFHHETHHHNPGCVFGIWLSRHLRWWWMKWTHSRALAIQFVMNFFMTRMTPWHRSCAVFVVDGLSYFLNIRWSKVQYQGLDKSSLSMVRRKFGLRPFWGLSCDMFLGRMWKIS